MQDLTKVVLLYGGKSGEHEVSLMSASSILHYLNPEKYEIIPIAIDKEGRCFQHRYADLLPFKDALPVWTKTCTPLDSLFVNGRFSVQADVVFPALHGPLYEDGCLQGLLELAGVAYVGSGVAASSIAMDKDMTRRLVQSPTARCARYKVLSWHSSVAERSDFCAEVIAAFGFPLFVKPNALGSSVGIYKVQDKAALETAIEEALRYDETILVEEFLPGREIEVAVLENSNPTKLPKVSVAGEIVVHHPDGFYSYAAKYQEVDTTDRIIPASLKEETLKEVQAIAAEVFTRLKCKGMARVDFFVHENGRVYLNEINTLPGFTFISMYPKLWEASGLHYADLLDALIAIACTHQRCRLHKMTNYL